MQQNRTNINTVEIIQNDDLINSYSLCDNDTNLQDISSCCSSSSNIILTEPESCEEDIKLIIAKWASRNSICHSVLDDLLSSLSKCFKLKNLHKDSRTLLHTPPVTVLKQIKGGVYHHFGILNEIEYLKKLYQNLPSTLLLIIGVDGLPVTKNPPSQLWPILGYFSNIPVETPKVFFNWRIFSDGHYRIVCTIE